MCLIDFCTSSPKLLDHKRPKLTVPFSYTLFELDIKHLGWVRNTLSKSTTTASGDCSFQTGRPLRQAHCADNQMRGVDPGRSSHLSLNARRTTGTLGNRRRTL